MSRSTVAMSLLALSAVLLVCCASPQLIDARPLRAEVMLYQLEVLVRGAPEHTYDFQGESYVLGQENSRYVLRVHNRSSRRVEAVVTVDGLDVTDGRAGDYANKRGYLIEAYGYVDIGGWRLTNQEAAAFRFAPIAASYAAKTGSARHVGVIGVAVFPERVRSAPRPAYVPKEYELSREGATLDGFTSAEPPPAASSGVSADKAAPRAEAKSARRERSGLSTEFGEAVSSEIRHVTFVRANATQPSELLGARYNDRAGLLALRIDLDGTSDLALHVPGFRLTGRTQHLPGGVDVYDRKRFASPTYDPRKGYTTHLALGSWSAADAEIPLSRIPVGFKRGLRRVLGHVLYEEVHLRYAMRKVSEFYPTYRLHKRGEDGIVYPDKPRVHDLLEQLERASSVAV